LKREFKIKEETMKKKYESLEDLLNQRLSDQENDFNERIEKMSYQIKEAHKLNDNLEKECEIYKNKLLNTERYIQSKELEFEDIVTMKDRKSKELEMYIKSISEEANHQINKLSESVSEFNDKINYYKNREMQITQDFINFKNQVKNKEQSHLVEMSQNQINTPNRLYSNSNNNFNSNNNNINNNTNTSNYNEKTVNKSTTNLDINPESSKSKTIEKLRARIKELEQENISISRDLSLKYEEYETLNEELRRAYEALGQNEQNTQLLVEEKENEILNLTNKINELDMVIQKYGQNLQFLKLAYDKSVAEHKNEITKKQNEFIGSKNEYEKQIQELKRKIEDILLKENHFIQTLNSNNIGTGYQNAYNGDMSYKLLDNINNYSNLSNMKNPYSSSYIPREIPDDEDVRRNINEQINYVRYLKINFIFRLRKNWISIPPFKTHLFKFS
jgi:hypothetical protein